ncbi:RHS repeat-associated core domain-containing protein [Tautonia rosea]|uniref:RHS repeat-associated core domain-containing protein n=1 Tax=Tautonia rosea TaxID=2728037 RepID=UPI001472DD8E|nr:RHS repeat-associated core domain-containing protein [Tautonia rosea]
MRRKASSRARLDFESLEKRELLATYRWLGGNVNTSGLYAWDLPANWFNEDLGQAGQGVPGAEDTARIVDNRTRVDLSRDVTVGTLLVGGSFRDQNHQIQTQGHTLTFGGGAINAGWLFGSFVNTGELTINALTGAQDWPLSITGDLTNTGTIDVQSGTLRTVIPVGGGLQTTLVNTDEAEIRIHEGATLGAGQTWIGNIQNHGTIAKVGGAGPGILGMPVINLPGGAFRVDSGTLQLTGSNHRFSGGEIVVAPGTLFEVTLEFIGGTTTQVTDPLIISGGGTVQLKRGEIQLNSSLFIKDNTAFLLESGDFAQSSRISGSGSLESGTIDIRKGWLSFARLTNRGEVRFSGQGSSESVLHGSTLINEGLVVFDAPSIEIAGSGLTNTTTGTIDIVRSGQLHYGIFGGSASNFREWRNEGLIHQHAGVESFSIASVQFINRGGTIQVDVGTFDLSGNIVSGWEQILDVTSRDATLIVSPGATLDWHAVGGVHGFGGLFTATGGGSVILGGTAFAYADDLILQGDSGMFRFHETSGWYGRIENRSDLTIESTTGQNIGLVGDFENYGTVRATAPVPLNPPFAAGTGRLFNMPGATFETAPGAWFVGGGLNSSLESDSGPLIRNEGHMSLDGTVTVNAKLDNLGTVEINGVTTFQGIRGQDLGSGLSGMNGTWIVHDGAEFRSNPTFNTIAGTVQLNGPGSVLAAANLIRQVNGALILGENATATFTLPLTNSGTITLSPGAILSASQGYTQTFAGTLVNHIASPDRFGKLIAGAPTALDGTLEARLSSGYVPGAETTFEILTSTALSGGFAHLASADLVTAYTGTSVLLGRNTVAGDLVVENVELIGVTGPLVPKQPFQIRYTVRNTSDNPVAGPWSDIVHLAQGATRGIGAALVGISGPTDNLLAGQSTVITLDLVTPALPGDWNVFVTTDRRGVIPDLDRSNNIGRSSTPLRIELPTLTLGSSATIALDRGESYGYALVIPVGAGPVELSALFRNGDAGDLRVIRAGAFNANQVEWTSTSRPVAMGREATLNLLDGVPGLYLVVVTSRAGGLVTTTAIQQRLEIHSFDGNDEIRRELHAGDTLTLTLRGSGFTPDTIFTLGGRAATLSTVFDPSSAIVTFADLAPGDTLALQATAGGVQALAPGLPFRVLPASADPAASQANWTVLVDMPRFSRPFREIPVTIRYRNDSTVSQPAPVLSVTTDNGRLRLASDTIYVGPQLGLLGVKTTGRPDLFAPGESGSIDLMLSPETNGDGVASNVTVSILPESKLTPAGVGPRSSPVLQPVALLPNAFDEIRPPTVNELAWRTTVKPNLISLVGTTTETYASALRHVADRFAQDGSETRDVARLLNYLLLVANDFGAISARFEQSAFGFGRTNPFEIRVETDAAGNLIVRSGDRIRPFFNQGTHFLGVDVDRGQIMPRPGGGWLLTETNGSSYAFRSDGLWEYTQDARGQRLTATYDGQRLIAFTNAYEDTTTIQYDAGGLITSVTNPVGEATTYTYDASRRFLTSVTSPEGNVTTYTYNLATTGPLAYTISGTRTSDGVTWNYEYDSFGRLSRSSRNSGQLPLEIRHGTDAQIGQITLIDPAGAVTVVTRGEYGQPGSITDPAGQTIDYHYDRHGRLIAAKGEEGTIHFTRNQHGRVTSILTPAGIAYQAAYTAENRLPTSIADPLGRVSTFSYDASGVPTSWTQPDGAVTQYQIDGFGRLSGVTNPRGNESRRSYDSRGLLTRIDYADGSRIEYTLDSRRKVTQIVETFGDGRAQSISFTYDGAGRISSLTDINGRVIHYEYDASGRLFRRTADGVAVETTFDNLSRRATVQRDGVVQVTYAYDVAGNLTSKTYANGTRTNYQYDLLGRTTRVEHRSGSGELLDFQTYTLDQAGRIASLTSPQGTTTYQYDARSQLVGVVLPDGKIHRYDVDATGNRLDFATDGFNRYTSDPDGRTFQYDASGNLSKVTETDGSVTTYGYDVRNRLVRISHPSTEITFEYDPLGNRSAVTRNGVRTDLLLDPFGSTGLGDVLAEYEGGSLRSSNLIADGLEARFDASGNASYYQFDAIGNTTAITDASGAVTATYRYLPFGEIEFQGGTGAGDNPFTYHGKWGVASLDLGLYDMRARLYDATTGRFTQPDPIGLTGGDFNLYRFVLNNPLSFIDPSGLQPGRVTSSNKINPHRKVDPITPGPKPGDNPYRDPAPQPSKKETEDPVLPETSPDKTIFSPEVTEGEPEEVTIPNFDFPTEVTTPNEDGSTATNTTTTEAFEPVDTSAYLLAGGGAVLLVAAGAALYFSGGTAAPVVESSATVILEAAASRGLIRVALPVVMGSRIANSETLSEEPLVPGGGGSSLQIVPRDPNDITGPGGIGEDLFRQPGGTYGYTIRFQNKPEASAPAQEVFITQTLDPDLDWDTFQLTSFGWAGYEFDVPAGRQSYTTRIDDPASSMVVEVTATLDASTGVLAWTFRSLDPISLDLPADALAGFLPPDDDSGRGQGFVSYTIEPGILDATGTQYDAQAQIVFDTEAALLTNIHRNTIDASPPVSFVESLPATSTPIFQVRFGGTDAGSGIKARDVWVQEDDGPWRIWLINTTLRSAEFVGNPGKTYRFLSNATDKVGNAEPRRITADTFTRTMAPGLPVVEPLSPTIVRSVVNGGEAQRSRVTRLQVEFNTVVSIAQGAFRLIRHDGRVIAVQVSSLRTVDGRSIATLTFNSPLLQAGSVPDGRYTLKVLAEGVVSHEGQPLSSSGSAVPNGIQVSTFHRLYGDTNGDARVNRADFRTFRNAFRSIAPETRYLVELDVNNDRLINRKDAHQFFRRLFWRRAFP